MVWSTKTIRLFAILIIFFKYNFEQVVISTCSKKENYRNVFVSLL